MPDTVLNPPAAKALRKLIARLAAAVSETVGSLVACEVTARPLDMSITDAEALLAKLSKPQAVVRGALDKVYAGQHLLVLFDVQDACTMAGLLMLTPEEVVEQRRTRGVLDGEDVQAFGEIGNVLCSGLGNVIRDAVPEADLRLHDHATIRPGANDAGLLPAGDLVVCRLVYRLGEHPESTASLVVARATAEAWNGGPLTDPEAEASGAAGATGKADGGAVRADEDLEDIPAAPVRGSLYAYLAAPDCVPVLRRSCRRVGLDMRRHGRAEIPNPAAHRGEIVLLDVPPGEERRFDWCRRIKEFDASTKVVVVLHRPSRARVAQAFLCQADVILGCPLDEPVLSQKLVSLLQPS